MPEPLYVLVNFVIVFLDVLSLAMFLRAIISWFFAADGKFSRFLYVLTEPAIMPLRKLFAKLNWFQSSPMDLSFTFTFFLIFIIQSILASFVA